MWAAFKVYLKCKFVLYENMDFISDRVYNESKDNIEEDSDITSINSKRNGNRSIAALKKVWNSV